MSNGPDQPSARRPDARPPAGDDDVETARDVLEAFNAEEVVDRPGEPPQEPPSLAADADIQPPG